jgi:two-component system nitrogen regulation sensor histidine kinase NtrY
MPLRSQDEQSCKLSRMNEMRKATRVSAARAPFRARLFAILLLFAVVPSILVTAAWLLTTSRTLPLVGATSAWDRVGETGERAISALAAAPLSPAQRAALDAHEAELRQSVAMARRFGFVVPRTVRLIAFGAVILLVGVALGASRVAGHLARQLSWPLDELVGWTALLRVGAPLPAARPRRGAPEFEVLRTGMRTMAEELDLGRRRALEAERADAFRESARRFAHELKNPLTPIRFAIDRLRRAAPPALHDTIEVLTDETGRLEAMARAFAQFGRLPDGPAADVDLGDLVTRAARATVPESLPCRVEVAPDLPLVRGHHDPLVRAVTNVLLNAVEACAAPTLDATPVDARATVPRDDSPAAQPEVATARLAVRVESAERLGAPAVRIRIADTGPGIPPERLARIFDPYVTTKPGGTGLGLAIARQTIHAHGGDVEADSTPGVGTEIRFVLPVTPPAPPSTSPSGVSP